jgi:hypothetical protein
VAAYVNEGFNKQLFSRAEAQAAVTACGFFCPEVKARGELKRAGQYIGAWHKAAPTKSHRPVPKHVCDLLCLRLLQHGDPGAFNAGVAILLGFSTYARHSELANLAAGDVRLPDNADNFLQDRGTIYLRKTKAGIPQTVILDDPWINRLLRSFLRIRQFDHKTQPFFDFGQHSLLFWFRWAQIEIGYADHVFVIHSTRHGGATHDFMTGKRNVSGIKVRGRWRSYQALQIYLQAMQANLAAEELPEQARAFFGSDTLRAHRILSGIIEKFELAFPARPVGA